MNLKGHAADALVVLGTVVFGLVFVSAFAGLCVRVFRWCAGF